MAYTLGNKCTKNCCKQTILVQLVIKNIVLFLEHKCTYIIELNNFCDVIFSCLKTAQSFLITTPFPRTDKPLL